MHPLAATSSNQCHETLATFRGQARLRVAPMWSAIALALFIAFIAFPAAAYADEGDSHERSAPARPVSLGVRLGLVPPVFAVAEFVVRPVPHVGLGAFGMAVSDAYTAGGELLVETSSPEASTPYIQAAYSHYEHSGANWERSQVAYLTAGGIFRAGPIDLQIGGGMLMLVADDLPLCSFFCLSDLFRPPFFLPTLDLGIHYRFL